MINKVTLYFYLLFVVAYFWSSASKAAPVIEWSPHHYHAVLEYARIDSAQDCREKPFQFTVDLPNQRDLDLEYWFKPGIWWKFRVVGQNTVSQTICVMIGEDDFYYLGLDEKVSF